MTFFWNPGYPHISVNMIVYKLKSDELITSVQRDELYLLFIVNEKSSFSFPWPLIVGVYKIKIIHKDLLSKKTDAIKSVYFFNERLQRDLTKSYTLKWDFDRN